MLRELAEAHGPFISIHLPPFARLSTEPLGTLESGARGRSLIVAGGQVLVDEPPAWLPQEPVVRMSDLPYVLPLTPRLDHASTPVLAEGLARCTAALTAGTVGTLVIHPETLSDRTVWVGGTHRDEVGVDPATPRAAGLPPNRQRADEALPMAALTIGAEIMVAENIPLTDGVGVLLRDYASTPASTSNSRAAAY
jgi:hypothetical protein